MFGVHEVSPTVRRRISLAASLAALMVLLLGARLWNLQVLRGEEMAALSENNRVRLRRDPATRGRVVDRTGAVVIDSQASFDAVVVPEDARDLPAAVEMLAQILGQSTADTQAALDRAAGRPAFQEVLIKRGLTYDEVAAIETHQMELAGVSLRVTPSRIYPHGPTLAHVLGYTGEVTPDDVEHHPDYRPGDVIGKAGLEKVWEGDLRGVEGGQQVEVDALGRELRVLDEAEAVPGHTLVLSVDLALQQAAEQALGDNVGAIVALDPRNGDVLAMVSEPSFDPNAFTGGIKPALWRELTTHPRHPLNARATQGQYPPGSTFKIIVAAAALEEGIVNPFTRIHCPGFLNFGNHTFRCWRHGGHGSVNVHDALVGSCDVFFYQMGSRLGIDTIARYAREFGLGAPTGIEIGNERSGLMPDTAWKKKRYQQSWQKGETLSVAIGQGCGDGDATADGGSGGDHCHRRALSAAPGAARRGDRRLAGAGDPAARRREARGARHRAQAGAGGAGRRRRARHRQERPAAGHRRRRQDRHLTGRHAREHAFEGEPDEVESARPRLVRRLRAGRGTDDRDRDPGRARRRRRRRDRGTDREGSPESLFPPARGAGGVRVAQN